MHAVVYAYQTGLVQTGGTRPGHHAYHMPPQTAGPGPEEGNDDAPPVDRAACRSGGQGA